MVKVYYSVAVYYIYSVKSENCHYNYLLCWSVMGSTHNVYLSLVGSRLHWADLAANPRMGG